MTTERPGTDIKRKSAAADCPRRRTRVEGGNQNGDSIYVASLSLKCRAASTASATNRRKPSKLHQKDQASAIVLIHAALGKVMA